MIPRIEVLLTEQQLADEFVRSIEQRHMDEKFFYWLPLSVRAWLALCSDGEYRNYVRSRSLISTSADEIADLARDVTAVVSLGSGQGDKDLLVLEALKRLKSYPSYLPLDSSQALLEIACLSAMSARFEVKGIKSDLLDPRISELLHRTTKGPRLFMMLGNTLGAFDPHALAERVANTLEPGEMWLVDGELYSGEETLAGYDNPINRRFAWGPLNSIGLDDSHGELVFETASDPSRDGLYRVEKHFIARNDVVVSVGGEELKIESGEKILMNHSCKYTRERFSDVLINAGLRPLWEGISDDGRFIMTLVERPVA